MHAKRYSKDPSNREKMPKLNYGSFNGKEESRIWILFWQIMRIIFIEPDCDAFPSQELIIAKPSPN